MAEKTAAMPLGVVLRCRPGVTRWQKEVWAPVAVIPFAGPADGRELRREGEVVDLHAATATLELHRAEVEAYKVSLSMTPPAVFVVLRAGAGRPEVHAVTASAYEAQDYMDSGEEIVEAVAMPDGLVAWVRDFTDAHFEETPFVKRRRDRKRVDLSEDGIGDARVRQAADVYRAPGAAKRRLTEGEG